MNDVNTRDRRAEMVLSDFTPLQCAHIRTVAIQGKKTKNMPGMRRAAGAKKDQQHQYQWFDLFVFFCLQYGDAQHVLRAVKTGQRVWLAFPFEHQ